MIEYDERGRAIVLSGVVSLKLNERIGMIGITTGNTVVLTVEEWEAMIEAWHRFKEEISWIGD